MFAVLEIQKNGATATPIITLFDSTEKDAAYSKYHQILASASISQVQEHSAILLSEEGGYMLYEKFVHEGE